MTYLGPEDFNTSEMIRCSGCGALMRADVFPALFRDMPEGRLGETLLVDDEASCFYHPKKKAVTPCSACGRFLCALCDMELNGRHLCPSCLEKGKKKQTIRNLESYRKLYDNMALFLAIFPMMFFWPTIITAPVVIFMGFRYWKAPSSIIPRTKIRFIIAFVIAALQIAGWSLLIYAWAT